MFSILNSSTREEIKCRKRERKEFQKVHFDWPSEVEKKEFNCDKELFEMMFNDEDYNTVVNDWLFKRPE